MRKVIIILFLFSFYLPANSSPKDKIISQMKLTNNLSFNFIQTINDKDEDGKCIIDTLKDRSQNSHPSLIVHFPKHLEVT